MTLTHEDVRQILAILDESGYEELRIEFGDFKLELLRHGDSSDGQRIRSSDKPEEKQVSQQPPNISDKQTIASTALALPKAGQKEAIPEGVVAVIAPMLGTCYRAPSPGAKPFIEVGDKVRPDDTVCLVEVMKLFNTLKAGVAGTVERVLFENATLVEYGQPLILIRKETA